MSDEWLSMGIKMSLFFVMLTGTLLYMPSQILVGVDPVEYQISSDFDSWMFTSNTTAIEHAIAHPSIVAYSFSDTTAKHQVDVVWDTWYGVEAIRARKHISQWFLFPNWYEPDVDLAEIEGGWDITQNHSKIRLSNNQGSLYAVFEDTNVTRNNITEAWTDNAINCTLVYGSESYENDVWTSKEVVLALLRFKIPGMLGDVSPYMSYLISALLYVPITYIVLAIVIKVFRG